MARRDMLPLSIIPFLLDFISYKYHVPPDKSIMFYLFQFWFCFYSVKQTNKQQPTCAYLYKRYNILRHLKGAMVVSWVNYLCSSKSHGNRQPHTFLFKSEQNIFKDSTRTRTIKSLPTVLLVRE